MISFYRFPLHVGEIRAHMGITLKFTVQTVIFIMAPLLVGPWSSGHPVGI